MGREEGKLLALRQMVAAGDLAPPVLLFVQVRSASVLLIEQHSTCCVRRAIVCGVA